MPYKFIKKNFLYFLLLLALVSTLGSLFFSEVLKLPPCVLCWYQRICMYPLVVIFAAGIYNKTKNLEYFVLPLSIIGLIIAVYHNLLYYKILPEAAAPCRLGISCTTAQLQLFGFITIPFLSLLSFISITILMLVYKYKIK